VSFGIRMAKIELTTSGFDAKNVLISKDKKIAKALWDTICKFGDIDL
jgi:hypothetical protein